MTHDSVALLAARLPASSPLLDAVALETYRGDEASMVTAGQPVAVARPASTDEVQVVLRIASSTGTLVVPRGAGSGRSGGANATDGCIVLSLERMNRVLEMNAAERIAVVQPGVVNRDLRRAASANDLFYPPDPSSYDWSTIGGIVATNAGGLCCVQHGVTRDSVLALASH